MSRRHFKKENGFVLEIGGRAVLALLASDAAQARGLCLEDWFVEELASYRSDGRAIWNGADEFTVRPASDAEVAEIQIALTIELVRDEYEGCVFAFLLPIDAARQ